MTEKPQVGTAMIITKDDKVLLMKRKGSHAPGTWSTPGGHLDFGETLEDCAAREAKEEIGVDVVDVRFRAVTNDIFEETGKHYVTVWMRESLWAIRLLQRKEKWKRSAGSPGTRCRSLYSCRWKIWSKRIAIRQSNLRTLRRVLILD